MLDALPPSDAVAVVDGGRRVSWAVLMVVPAVFRGFDFAATVDELRPEVEAWRLIRAHRCRVMVGATPFLHGLLGALPTDRPPLTLFACGGADVPGPLVERASRELRCLVVLVEELPRTASGKVQKHVLRSLLGASR